MKIKRNIKLGTIVLVKYGYNSVLKRPFQFLYEFDYYNTSGGCVVYNQGERNMQDSHAFKLEQVRVATPNEIAENFYGN